MSIQQATKDYVIEIDNASGDGLSIKQNSTTPGDLAIVTFQSNEGSENRRSKIYSGISGAGGTRGKIGIRTRNSGGSFVDALEIDHDQHVTVGKNVSTTAGGNTTGALKFGSSGVVGVYFGSGAPSISAGKGSLYMRTDGSGVYDRIYVNTDGGTTWTAVVTVA